MTLTEIVDELTQITEVAKAKILTDKPLIEEPPTANAYHNMYTSICQRMDTTTAMNGTLRVLLIAAVSACPECDQAKLLEKLNTIAGL